MAQSWRRGPGLTRVLARGGDSASAEASAPELPGTNDMKDVDLRAQCIRERKERCGKAHDAQRRCVKDARAARLQQAHVDEAAGSVDLYQHAQIAFEPLLPRFDRIVQVVVSFFQQVQARLQQCI